ncbi:MAG: hypothetical protein RM368_21380 [Nostoc sp. DedSLP03]|uniref:hypothetical protein n=1 Tax=Nostoc sp. DedSLP03 TaxID=3075400 RepID=UPI002AD559EE|nr:hypothetical protein [Nostoc sp. DedSLP03]MDZ7967472.1 hypothetical protein [Nostoc sp. DedSLP03]
MSYANAPKILTGGDSLIGKPICNKTLLKSALHHAELDITPAVGVVTATEFQAFIQLYKTLPNLTPILAGKGDRIPCIVSKSQSYDGIVFTFLVQRLDL